MSSTTSVLQDHLGAAEDRLGKLQIQQEELVSEQEELKTGITNELARLDAKIDAAKLEVVDPGTAASTTTTNLRPTAPAFIPLSLTTGGGGESGSKSMQPVTYDWKSSW